MLYVSSLNSVGWGYVNTYWNVISNELFYHLLSSQILQLQKQLEDQFFLRSALEKALTYRPVSHETTNEKPITKVASFPYVN